MVLTPETCADARDLCLYGSDRPHHGELGVLVGDPCRPHGTGQRRPVPQRGVVDGPELATGRSTRAAAAKSRSAAVVTTAAPRWNGGLHTTRSTLASESPAAASSLTTSMRSASPFAAAGGGAGGAARG